MQTPGEILKHQRQKVGKTIFEVSQETKILEKYLKQIENNQFDLFDSPVFARGFTKIYAEYLGLDVEKLLALFRRENKEETPKRSNIKKKNFSFKNILKPTNLTILGTIVFFLFLFFYFVFIYINFQIQPKITIFTPVNGFTSETKDIFVEGNVTKNSILKINGSQVNFTNNYFKFKYTLNEGENSIEVEATNSKNNRKYEKLTLNVIYKPKTEEVKEENKTEVSTFKIQLKIKNEATWIKLIIDDNQVYAQVIKAGFSGKFNVKNSFEVVSGKPDNTQVLINGAPTPLVLNKTTGVASLACKLENSEVNCSK